ncbi:MAG TPA: S8 family serine peptidase [Lacunisphaera sp.]|jgi:subtilisin family serine protease|nr:S8 family serine peptidase [Lacunisphaera sp.]
MSLFAVLVLAWPLSLPAQPAGAAGRDVTVPARPAPIAPDHLIVHLKQGRDLDPVLRAFGADHRRIGRKADLRGGTFETVKLPPGLGAKVRAALEKSGLVDYVEPDYVMSALVEPNDFRFWDGSTWHLKNTGIYGGTVGADIHATTAWDTRTSATDTVVAVIDTGVRYTHEDLAANMWVNPGESGLDANGMDKATNGIDDDGDGYVDDVHGINVLNHTGNPMDDFGHGTHVAGIVGAVGNNSVGIVGVAWQARIMALKFLDYQGNGTISGAIECMEYARAKGARIINASWGSYAFTSQALRDEIATLGADGILFVAACGNSGGDNDANPLFPASYEYDNIIAVAATTRTDSKPSWSNWGHTTVDLAAPGSPIFSTWNGSDSDYRYMDGTSMAAPVVAGAAAILWSQSPSLTYLQVKQLILDHTDPCPDYSGKTVSGGRLNLALALAAIPSNPPGAPTALQATSSTATSVTLGWTDNATTETGFTIERAPGTTTNFVAVGTVGANVTTFTDSGLSANTAYSYRVRAQQNAVYSSYSNTATVTTASAPPPPPPAAPTMLQATNWTTSTVTLSWTDNSSTETGFSIERAPGTTTTFAAVGTVGANVTSFTDSGLTANTTYTYRVRAQQDTVYSDYSNTSTVTTASQPPPPPAAPTMLQATNPTATGVTLSWTDNSTTETGFSIERAPGTTTTFAAVGTVGANVTTFTDSGLTANTTYTYRVRAQQDTVYSNYSNSATVTTASGAPGRTDVIWVEDALPAGAWGSTAGGDVWNWITASPAPYSGTKAHQSAIVAGYHDHTFHSASATMTVAAGDTLILYVYVDPANPPQEIMVSWFAGNWEHRAYWGANLISYGNNGTASRWSMGALPATGQWVRLEVPASAVGLEGATINSMSFSLYDGRVTWDAAGRSTTSP